jgi:hypothetical protein
MPVQFYEENFMPRGRIRGKKVKGNKNEIEYDGQTEPAFQYVVIGEELITGNMYCYDEEEEETEYPNSHLSEQEAIKEATRRVNDPDFGGEPVYVCRILTRVKPVVTRDVILEMIHEM